MILSRRFSCQLEMFPLERHVRKSMEGSNYELWILNSTKFAFLINIGRRL